MKTTARSLAAAALITLASAAGAHPPGDLSRLDGDGDGAVSREEFESREKHGRLRLFERADGDGDGQISRDELQAALEQAAEERRQSMETRMLALFDEMDSDGSGVVTREELTAHAFARIDADGDGYISEEEARAMREHRPARRGRPPGAAGQRPSPSSSS